jgi:hypothetical protein
LFVWSLVHFPKFMETWIVPLPCRFGHQFTHTPSHWSTYDTMVQYVESILRPYFLQKCELYGLDPEVEKLLWLLDCWSIHIKEEFREYLKAHTWIVTLYIPARCTGKLQPVDLGLGKPFKDRYKGVSA